MKNYRSEKLFISVVISIGIMIVCFISWSNIDRFSYKYTYSDKNVEYVFLDDNTLSFKDKDSVIFSVINYSTLDLGYDIYLKASDLDFNDLKNIKIKMDKKEYVLSDLEVFGDLYKIDSLAISNKASLRQEAAHEISIDGSQKGGFEVVLNTVGVSDLAGNVIKSMAYDGNPYGLVIDNDGEIRYASKYSNNYIEVHGDLYRIIGVFNNLYNKENHTSYQLKLVSENYLDKRMFGNQEDITYNNSSLMNYLNEDYFNKITYNYDFDLFTYNFRDYRKGEILSNTSKATIPTVEDFNKCSWMRDGIWLYGFDSANLNEAYAAFGREVDTISASREKMNVAPVMFLKSNALITGGDGSKERPFVIE